MRIKQAELEKKAAKRKQEGDHSFIKWKQKCDSKRKKWWERWVENLCVKLHAKIKNDETIKYLNINIYKNFLLIINFIIIYNQITQSRD